MKVSQWSNGIMMRSIALSIIYVLIVQLPAIAKDLSVNIPYIEKATFYSFHEEGFGAYFPAKPESMDMSSQQMHGTKYYAIKRYSEGNVVFSVTSSSIPKNAIPRSLQDQKTFLSGVPKGIAIDANAIANSKKTKLGSFSDGRPMLFYQYGFIEDGVPIHVKGYFVVHNEKSMNISIMHHLGLPDKDALDAKGFLTWFTLFK